MEFLDRFSLEDVAIVFIGLVIVSIIRIWFEAHVNRKKATRFGSSLGIYNNLVDDSKEGLFILSNDGQIIFSNIEATNILNIKANFMDATHLEEIIIGDKNNSEKETLLKMIHSKTYLPNAYLVDDKDSKSISISINKLHSSKYMVQACYIIVLQDMTQMNELRDGAQTLLSA